ncbi:hypothetical protein E1286_13510 [Nonomuraea terrae]|uniref:Uncharacterized protein n=1 Tax=Nonomuraea terrae TaxID=2530383 RepID=A0A4R4YWG7_9ACTN|nr:hypothetical protein [Nonomuraea terrae]TDD49723.1 hypothetical protein E1286_13510 [Nonomuraea terrae]
MRILVGCLATAVIVPLVGLFLLIAIPMWRDDARFDDFQERVLAYPLPPQTRIKGDIDATFGKNTSGNGDYCAYSVQMVLQTALSQKEIRVYYSKAAIAGVDGRDEAWVSLDFSEDSDNSGAVTVEFTDLTPSDWNVSCS